MIVFGLLKVLVAARKVYLVCHLRLGVDDLPFLINIVDVNIIDPIVEIPHVQGQTVVVNQLYVVDLLVDVLITA